jgi:hypothetical protein
MGTPRPCPEHAACERIGRVLESALPGGGPSPASCTPRHMQHAVYRVSIITRSVLRTYACKPMSAFQHAGRLYSSNSTSLNAAGGCCWHCPLDAALCTASVLWRISALMSASVAGRHLSPSVQDRPRCNSGEGPVKLLAVLRSSQTIVGERTPGARGAGCGDASSAVRCGSWRLPQRA